MALSLAPFADITALLDLQGSNIGNYPDIELIQGWVRGSFESYTQRTLEEDTGVEVPFLGASGTGMVPLQRLPVTSVNSVSVGGDALDKEQYTVQPYGLLLSLAVSDSDAVEVDYTGGYTDSTLPGDLKRAATLQVVHEIQIRDHFGAQSVQNEGGTVNRPPIGLLDEVERLLHPYVHPNYFAGNIMI